MQQLNVLPINVSQNVETKDDTTAPLLSSSKDDFSQHIDLHLAKNKDVGEYKNKASDENVETKIDKASTDQRNLKTDGQSQDSSDTSQALADENDSASDAQEVAASGKEGEIESSKAKVGDENQTVDESELLISFLTKADKTLVDGNSAEGIKLGEMSEEQKAKYEAQLLLKSSDLVADLSGVAKAVTSSSDDGSEDFIAQEKAINSLLASSKNTKTNTDINQLNAKPLIEENSLQGKNLEAEKLASENSDKLNKENSLSQQLNATKLGGKGSDDSTSENKKVVELVPNKSTQQLGKSDIEGKISSQVDVDSEKAAHKKFSQQSLMSASKNIDSSNTKSSSKSSVNTQALNNAQNPFESESKINEQIAKLIQNENGVTKAESNLTSAISVAQNSVSQGMNKNATAANLGQTIAESLVKEGSLAESEAKLSAKSVDSLIEQSTELSDGESKGVSAKVFSKTNTDFSVNGSFLDTTGRATQAAYDRVDQQSAEIFNPTGSSEVSQSQKTNTQLHHETISIFRRDFADAVKDKVMLMISQKLQQFDITLDPPELGNMQVRVNLQGEQATVNFVVQNQQAKEALEQSMHKLKDMLAEQGVDVGDANVEQQSQQSDKEETAGDNQNNLMTNTADASDVIEHSLTARMHDSSAKVVDYYA